MNLREIEKLLEKYFEGETSLSEEKQLRDFFASGNVPGRLKNMEGYFTFLTAEQGRQIENENFDDSLMSSLKENKLAPLIDLHRPWIYWISGVAAGLLILIAVFVKFDPFSGRMESTYKDPQTAYSEARKILLYVSSKFNQGTSTLQPISKLEAGMGELKPVASFDRALNEVNRVNELQKVEKMIMNN